MNNELRGSGGKGGGGQTFREDENTLRANVIVSTLEAWGEGPILGPVLGGKSIFLNNTPLTNNDGTLNFGGKIGWAIRDGLPTQDPIPGFEYTGSPITVNTEVTQAAPVVQTVSSADVDAIVVTIALPQGLYAQDTANNAMLATTVELAIDVKLTSSGAWQLARSIVYNDKTTSAYQESFRVERPGATLWEARVRRITPDNASSTLRNNTSWVYFTELQQNASLTYPDVAYMGVQVDAAAVNSTQIPTRAVELYGLIVEVPSNYDEKTRVFTGVWDGTFRNAWTNDPAWVVYALLTNTRWGLGLSPDIVDRYSFYEASVYNSELVDYTYDGVTKSAPRFSFNYQISQGEVAIDLLNKVASVMNAKLMWMGGQVTVSQDRPTDVSHIFSKSNIIGHPSYRGTSLQQRNTVANVTWNDPANRYQQRVSSVEDATGIAKYGYNPANIAAYGCTGEPQAIRFGKWYLDTVLNQTEMVTFDVGPEGQLVVPGEVFELFDEDYTAQVGAGRLLAGSDTTTLFLDRELDGNGLIDLQLPDGTLLSNLQYMLFREGGVPEGRQYLNLVTPLASPPPEYTLFIANVADGAEPRTFRVMKVSEKERGIFTIEGATYDENKYARVEGGVVKPLPVFTRIRSDITGRPTNLTLTERVIYVDNKITRSVVVSWTQPANSFVTGYQVAYRTNGGTLTTVTAPTTFIELKNIEVGTFEVKVQGVSYRGVLGLPATGTLTIVGEEETGSTLQPVTNLQVVGGGTDFAARTLTVEWTNPTANGLGNVSVSDFKVEVYASVNDSLVLLRTEYAPFTAPGNTQSFIYTYDMNLVDGGPRRSVVIKVYARDGNKLLSTPASQTFSNPVPAALTGLVATAGIGNISLSWNRPVDNDAFVGVLIWRGTTAGFTPSAANLIGDSTGTTIMDAGLSSGTTYYYKAAGYDAFARPTDGADLNITLASGDSLTLATAGIPQGATNPVSGNAGDLFFNTTDNLLYHHDGVGWTTAVKAVDLSGTITHLQIGIGEVQSGNLGTASVLSETIADGVVTFQKLTMTDVNNYAINGLGVKLGTTPGFYPNWLNCLDWTNVESNPTIAATSTPYMLAWTGGTGSAYNQYFETKVGEQLLLTFSLGVPGGSTPAAGFVTPALDGVTYTMTKIDGSPWPTATVDGSGVVTNPLPDGTYQVLFTITAGDKARLKFDYLQSAVGFGEPLNNGAGFSGGFYFYKVILHKKNAAELIVDGGIITSHLSADVVTADKIAANSVTADKIAANSITAEKIAALAVETEKLAANSVTADKIVANAITAGKIAASAVETDKLAANAVTADKIQSNSVTTDKIAANSITIGKMAANSVGSTELVADSVGSTHIADDAVTAAQLAASSVTGEKIAIAAVGETKIENGAITTDKIAANSITAVKIVAGTITASQIAADTITANEIAAGTITSTEIATGTITADNITVGTITTDRIQVGAVTTSAEALLTSQTIYNSTAVNAVQGELDLFSFTSTGKPLVFTAAADLIAFPNVTTRLDLTGGIRFRVYNGATLVAEVGGYHDCFSVCEGDGGAGVGAVGVGFSAIRTGIPAGTYTIKAYCYVQAMQLSGIYRTWPNVLVRLDFYGECGVLELKV